MHLVLKRQRVRDKQRPALNRQAVKERDERMRTPGVVVVPVRIDKPVHPRQLDAHQRRVADKNIGITRVKQKFFTAALKPKREPRLPQIIPVDDRIVVGKDGKIKHAAAPLQIRIVSPASR